MAAGSELASAWVTIYPKFARNFNSTITKQISSAVSGATKGLGSGAKSAGMNIGRSLGSGIQSGLSATKVAIGNVIASGITSAVSAATTAVTSTVGDAIERADILNNFPKMMEQWGESADTAEASVKKLRAGVEGLPTTTASMVQATQRLYTMLGDVEQASDAAIGLNDMLLSNGASGALYENAFEQFAQMLSAGKVDMMAWRSVVNAAPKSVDTLAKSLLGATANATDLYNALPGSQGYDSAPVQLELQDLVDKIIELDKTGADGMGSFSEQAHMASKGIKTSLTNIKNAITNVQTDFLDALGRDKIAGEIDKLKAKIYDFGKWFNSSAIFAKIKAKLDAFDMNEVLDKLQSRISRTIDWINANVLPPVQRIVSSVRQAIGSISDFIQSRSSTFEGLFLTVLNGAADGIAGMVNGGTFDEVLTFIGNFVDRVVQLAKTLWPYIKRLGRSVSQILGTVGKSLEKHANTFEGLFVRIVDFVTYNIDAAVPVIATIIDKVIGLLAEVAEWLNARFDDGSFQSALETLWSIMKGIHEWVVDNVIPVAEKVWGAFQPVLGHLQDEFQKLVDGEAGAGIGDTAAKGVQLLGDTLVAIFQFIDQHWEDIMACVEELGEAIASFIDGVARFAEDKGETIWEFFENLLSVIEQSLTNINNIISEHGEEILGFFESLADILGGSAEFAADNWDWLGPLLLGWLATTKLLIPAIKGIGTAFKGVKTGIGKGKAGVDWIKNLFKGGEGAAAEGAMSKAAGEAAEELKPLSEAVAAVNEKAIADTADAATAAVADTTKVAEAGAKGIDDVAKAAGETLTAAETSAAGVASSAEATAAGMESAAQSAGTLGDMLAGITEKFPWLKTVGKVGKYAGPLGWALMGFDALNDFGSGQIRPGRERAELEEWAPAVLDKAMDELLKRSSNGDTSGLDLVDQMRFNQLYGMANGNTWGMTKEEFIEELSKMNFSVSMNGQRVAYMRASDNADASGDFQMGAQRGWAYG